MINMSALHDTLNGFHNNGLDLIATKKRLGHGHFLAWIDAEFGMTDRTARNFMRAAERFGAKSEIVSDLPATTIYMLAAPSTPETVREDVVRRIEAGERLVPAEVKKLVKQAREEKKAKRLRLTREQRASE